MIRHTSCGIWELYEDVRPKARQWMSLHSVRSAIDGLPYVWRMFMDVARIPGIWPLLGSYLVVVLILSVLPAVTLVCNASLLSIVQTAVDRRTIEEHVLLRAVVGLVLCSAGAQLFNHFKGRLTTPLNSRIKSHYSVHIFASMVRLDVPTFNDPAVQRLLEQTCTLHSHSTVAFIAISAALDFASSLIRITSQISVLIAVLRNYPDAFFLVCLSCTSALYKLTRGQHVLLGNSDLWVATTTNKDFIRSEGLKRAASDHVHRKEIVAGGIAPFLLSQYHKSMTTLFDCVMNFFEAVYMNPDRRRPIWDIILQEFLHTLPQVIFALRAVHQPTSIPVSLASFNVVTTTTQSFVSAADSLIQSLGSLSYHILSVRQLYEVAKIPNRIKVQSVYEKTDADETFIGTPFPEDDKTLVHGISVEFRDVSFIYPGNTAYALRHVSFKLERGQLCVIVGNNGSGKSTILKLISRLYDPTEGTILVDGVDIKTLRLADLRRCVSVLFQDYTLFPLSIHDNIALGDPTHADDRDKVERAAQLGGADAFIERLPEKYDTYLERPIRDFYSPHAEGTPNPSDGSIVDFTALRAAAGISQTSTDGAGGGVGNKGLSGGQMQRIALSRMFMRSVVSDESVGLLLFDEPSASLDPTAEHDLFERLRTLRGNKTMVFSTHRFGNLTRYADRILYMDDSRIVEEGTHDELIAHGGEYARIWMLQARAFL